MLHTLHFIVFKFKFNFGKLLVNVEMDFITYYVLLNKVHAKIRIVDEDYSLRKLHNLGVRFLG